SANTPFLDRLADEGAVYENVWSPGAATYLSVPSLFTGLDPYESNSFNLSEWNSGMSLVPRFEAAGYYTAGFSANSLVGPLDNFDAGFRFFRVRFWPPADVMFNELKTHFLYSWKNRFPFFLYVHLIDPHDPYFAPDAIADLSRRGRPPGFAADPRDTRHKYVLEGLNPADYLPPGNAGYMRTLYDEEVRYADGWLERTFNMMKDAGALDGTLVVVTADHGEMFLEHGDLMHGTQLYEETVRVPLILWGSLPPGLKPGTRVAEPHSLMELLPSILDWQGIEAPGAAAKRATLFPGQPPPPPPFVATTGLPFDAYGEDHELICIRDGDFKLILDVTAGERRLFNLSDDPGERRDLSEEMPPAADRLAELALAQRDASRRANAVRDDAKPSPTLIRRLKALGYVK
ncbi:MAG: sulfatase, partial [bacterium]